MFWCVLFLCSWYWLCSFIVVVVFVDWFGLEVDLVGFVDDVEMLFDFV